MGLFFIKDFIMSNQYDNQLEYKKIHISDLTPHPQNPNTHSKVNINEITASIETVGYIDPIIVRPHGDAYQILAGEGRYLACKHAGINEVPVISVVLTDEQALAYMVASNEIPRSSEINANKFEEVIKTLNSINPNFNWTSIGLSEQEAGALLNFDINVINDGAPSDDLHDGIKDKVKPIRLDLEQRAFIDYVVHVFNSLDENSKLPETEVIMCILSDWLSTVIPAQASENSQDSNELMDI